MVGSLRPALWRKGDILRRKTHETSLLTRQRRPLGTIQRSRAPSSFSTSPRASGSQQWLQRRLQPVSKIRVAMIQRLRRMVFIRHLLSFLFLLLLLLLVLLLVMAFLRSGFRPPMIRALFLRAILLPMPREPMLRLDQNSRDLGIQTREHEQHRRSSKRSTSLSHPKYRVTVGMLNGK